MSDTKEQRVIALHDQAWAALRGRYGDIRRIADHGADDDEYDGLLIRAVFCAVAGDLQRYLGEAITNPVAYPTQDCGLGDYGPVPPVAIDVETKIG